VRANLQLDVDSWVPRVLSVSGDDGESEPAAFAKDLLSGVRYVVDRNFLDFGFLGALLAKDNDLVLRVRANAPATHVTASLPPTAPDAEAGVVADERVELTGRGAPAGTFRLVTIRATDRRGEPETVRLLTNLTDADNVPARVVGAVYRLRWQVELFFKWLKCFARMDHLLSTSRRGITTQLYVAVIAVLLMHVQTGRRVSIYALAALSRVARGEQTIDQAMEFLARRERERDLARLRQARRRQRKKLA
jgi:IS4 transposase